jgi:RimJ/RimL family protein N-acetyltransferase
VPAQGKVECRFGGEHIVWTDRLRLSLARHSEQGLARTLNFDEVARYWNGWPDDVAPWPVLDGSDPLPRLTADVLPFIGVEPATGALLVDLQLYRSADDGAYQVGGSVAAGHRGRGYGWEALMGLCELAHHHFGIRRLTAGCEVANVASQAWLASCGFWRVEGTGTRTLPNGRVIDSVSWERVDASAYRRCREFPPT